MTAEDGVYFSVPEELVDEFQVDCVVGNNVVVEVLLVIPGNRQV